MALPDYGHSPYLQLNEDFRDDLLQLIADNPDLDLVRSSAVPHLESWRRRLSREPGMHARTPDAA